MKNWIAKIILQEFAEPVLDCIIAILERLSLESETTIDNYIVEQFKAYKDTILSFLLAEIDSVVKNN